MGCVKLLHGQRDLRVWISDLVAFIEHDIVEILAQEVVLELQHLAVRGHQHGRRLGAAHGVDQVPAVALERSRVVEDADSIGRPPGVKLADPLMHHSRRADNEHRPELAVPLPLGRVAEAGQKGHELNGFS